MTADLAQYYGVNEYMPDPPPWPWWRALILGLFQIPDSRLSRATQPPE